MFWSKKKKSGEKEIVITSAMTFAEMIMVLRGKVPNDSQLGYMAAKLAAMSTRGLLREDCYAVDAATTERVNCLEAVEELRRLESSPDTLRALLKYMTGVSDTTFYGRVMHRIIREYRGSG